MRWTIISEMYVGKRLKKCHKKEIWYFFSGLLILNLTRDSMGPIEIAGWNILARP